MKDQTARSVADAFLQYVVYRHGVPRELVTDQGSQFLSEFFAYLCKALQVTQVATTPYHHSVNGMPERLHRFIGQALQAYVNTHHSNWDQFLAPLAFAYRTAVVDGVGDTPFFLLHGRDPRLPTDLLYAPPELPQSSQAKEAVLFRSELSSKLKTAFASAQATQVEAKA